MFPGGCGHQFPRPLRDRTSEALPTYSCLVFYIELHNFTAAWGRVNVSCDYVLCLQVKKLTGPIRDLFSVFFFASLGKELV